MIVKNLKTVHATMLEGEDKQGELARRMGRAKLVCVSKTKPLSMVLECVEAGEDTFGENYVQELIEKYETVAKEYPQLMGRIHWHMIGHLQRNKVKYIIDKVDMIHSVDSERLASQIEQEAAKKNLIVDALLEINVAEEESKWGFTVSEATAMVVKLERECPHIRWRGYMTSAPYTEDEESNRSYFAQLRSLLTETVVQMEKENLTEQALYFNQLSMGMTGDYRVAVEEGATLVRVGTGVFGERDYSHLA